MHNLYDNYKLTFNSLYVDGEFHSFIALFLYDHYNISLHTYGYYRNYGLFNGFREKHKTQLCHVYNKYPVKPLRFLNG